MPFRRKKVFPVLIVVMVISTGPVCAQEPVVKDCGSDAQCFVGAGQTCAPATFVTEQHAPARDADRTITTTYTIRGRSDGECIVGVAVTNADRQDRKGQTNQLFHRRDMLLAPADFAREFIEKPADAEIRALLKGKKKVEAVKRYREVHGVGLAEAAKAVDKIQARGH